MKNMLLRISAIFICFLTMGQSAIASSVSLSAATLLSTKTIIQNHQTLKRGHEERCLALGLYHEARGEPAIGQYAVGVTILNRVRSAAYPNSVCGVVLQNQHREFRCQFSFACDKVSNEPVDAKSFIKMQRLAHDLLENGFYREAKFISQGFQSRVHEMTHYHRYDVNPLWSKKLEKISLLGAHVFFKSERVTKRYTY